MPKYTVRVWISDIEVEAKSDVDAEDFVSELIENGDILIKVENAEAQQKLINGEWKDIVRS